jgi:hypothetical protein
MAKIIDCKPPIIKCINGKVDIDCIKRYECISSKLICPKKLQKFLENLIIKRIHKAPIIVINQIERLNQIELRINIKLPKSLFIPTEIKKEIFANQVAKKPVVNKTKTKKATTKK